MTLILISRNYDLWLCLCVHLKLTSVSTAGLDLLTCAAAENKPCAVSAEGLTMVPPHPAEAVQAFTSRVLQVSQNRMSTVRLSGSTRLVIKGYGSPCRTHWQKPEVTSPATWWELQFRAPEEARWQTEPPSSFINTQNVAPEGAHQHLGLACGREEREGVRWETQIVWIECRLLKGRHGTTRDECRMGNKQAVTSLFSSATM